MRWAAHIGRDGLCVSEPQRGISLLEFAVMYTSNAFPRVRIWIHSRAAACGAAASGSGAR